ncbi:MAG TPA: DUF2490 domain-containing protein [Candidatus Binatia bacterium]|nr:DUF2490 domain-containing protein [Candidatus Binatia bacterium]
MNAPARSTVVKSEENPGGWPMGRFGVIALATFVSFSSISAAAQTFQFWPEVDTYVKLSDNARFFFEAKQTRENRTGEDGEIGPSLDVYFKPIFRLKKIVVFQLDQSKSRPLMFRVGYRYMPSTQNPTENRAILEATPRYPLVHGILVTDRSRGELRFIQGRFSWRYRNRLTTERTFGLGSFHFTPYLRAETYYDSDYGKFSRTAIDGGSTFPIGKHVELEGYYEHQNDTSKTPNRQIDAVALVLSFYISKPQ